MAEYIPGPETVECATCGKVADVRYGDTGGSFPDGWRMASIGLHEDPDLGIGPMPAFVTVCSAECETAFAAVTDG